MQDAVRHFAWQAALTFVLGWSVAWVMGNAHEYNDQHSGNARRIYESNVDLKNNSFARGWVLNLSHTASAALGRVLGAQGFIGLLRRLIYRHEPLLKRPPRY
jgi:hypothetical protein